MRSMLLGARLPAGFWWALSVLAVNDHLLKGSWLLPGVVPIQVFLRGGIVVALLGEGAP